MNVDEDFLGLYFEELNYLREAGLNFARKHDKIAARLDMHNGESADPHVERLIESFAFLTARLQRQMHAEFPEITSALLGALYPQLTQPLPPMGVVCFDVGNTIEGLTDGFPIPPRTPLFAQDSAGLTARFRTCYDTTLWPVKVTRADFESGSSHGISAAGVLRLRLEARSDLLMNRKFLPSLRFFLNGSAELTMSLWETIFAHTSDILITDSTDVRVSIGSGALAEVGFGKDEQVLPYPGNALPAYRLIQEYFNFPRKFLFFDVHRLLNRYCAQGDGIASDFLDLIFVLRELPRRLPSIHPANFRLGCTPVINLFAKTTEPIRFDHKSIDYRLVADLRREATTEIHSILSVTGSANPAKKSRAYHSFYSFRQPPDGESADSANPSSEPERRAFWLARRVVADRKDVRGTDIYLSFVDAAFNPAVPSDETVFAHTLCTNRWLATQLPDHAAMNIEDTTPVLRIHVLGKLTHPLYPPLDGPSLWRLVSSLNLNAASLTSDEDGLRTLQDTLRLYSLRERGRAEHEIDGMVHMDVRRILRRFGADAWRGYRRGHEVLLDFDTSHYSGSSALMLASVLRHFLGLYSSVNTFAEVAVRRKGIAGEWKRWSPLAGAQELL